MYRIYRIVKMFESIIERLFDVFTTTMLWMVIFCVYTFIGFVVGSKASNIHSHNVDDLTWLGLYMALFAFVLFPLTFFIYYTL